MPSVATVQARSNHHPSYKHAYYMEKFVQVKQLKECCALALTNLKLIAHKFDAIAFRGMSGALVAPYLAMKLGKEMIMVRKGEDCHSSHEVEGDSASKRYVIVDDFISSGKTIGIIVASIADRDFAPHAKCIGVLEVQNLTKQNCKEDRLTTNYEYNTGYTRGYRDTVTRLQKERDGD